MFFSCEYGINLTTRDARMVCSSSRAGAIAGAIHDTDRRLEGSELYSSWISLPSARHIIRARLCDCLCPPYGSEGLSSYSHLLFCALAVSQSSLICRACENSKPDPKRPNIAILRGFSAR